MSMFTWPPHTLTEKRAGVYGLDRGKAPRSRDDCATRRVNGSSARRLAGKQAALTLIYISRNTAARGGRGEEGRERTKRGRREGERAQDYGIH